MKLPTRNEIKLKLQELIKDNPSSRKIIADWAIKYIINDNEYDVKDLIVWSFLIKLSGADLMDSPSTYLHDVDNLSLIHI